MMKNKVTIIGAGHVGSTIAYSLIMKDFVEDIAIIDLNKKLAAAQVMDLEHSAPFVGQTDVKVGTYEDCADSAVAVITCGASQKPGETRLELVEKNAAIIKEIVPKIFEQNPDIVIVMVTNPVDVLTYLAVEMFPEKKQQIMGTGTLLDSVRLRHLIGEKLQVNPKSIHAYVIGEHGDSEFPLWSSAAVGNMKLGMCKELTEADKEEIFHDAKTAAYTIIEGKQSTYYAIGAGAANLIQTILFDQRTVLPVSFLMEGEHGFTDVCLSMPAIVGREGVVGNFSTELNQEEETALRESVRTLKETIASVS